MKRGARVLIVEDSPSQAAVIADVVRQCGHEAAILTDFRAPIQQVLAREEPDLVLLDLRLLDADGNQVADGFQMCRDMKRSPQKPHVIVITAEGDDEAYEWAILQGADGFLQKPFAVADLNQILGEILG